MDTNHLCPNCMNEIKEGSEKCPSCGYDLQAPQEANLHALKPYTILQGKYLVGNVIGEGGFGITYIGFDLNLEVKIAIKEFYPNGFVTRESNVTSMVTNYTTGDKSQYDKWKESFVREARSLAKFSDLPGIVHVRDFFQENNTAYIVMEFVEGETLKSHLKACGGKISVDETLTMMRPVIQSLAKVHEAGIVHRDISPDNIMIQKGGTVKLIDFGAARDFGSEGEKSLSVLLKPGYAPEEQYRSKGNQGPWTDVYAMCATIYRCITGTKPAESMERMREDTLKKPSGMGIAIDADTENALMSGMAVYAEQRIKTMDELESRLYKNGAEITSVSSRRIPNVSQKPTKPSNKGTASKPGDQKQKVLSKIKGKEKYIVTGVVAALLLILIISVVRMTGNKKTKESADINTVTENNIVAETPPEADTTELMTESSVDAEEEAETEISECDKYREAYAEIVNKAWHDEKRFSWTLTGLEIINLNANESETPEIITLWDTEEGPGEEIFGLECTNKENKIIGLQTSGSYSFEAYRNDEGQTTARVINENNVEYLVDSYGNTPFAFARNTDYPYAVNRDYAGRASDVYQRASDTPVEGWTPSDLPFLQVTYDEKEAVFAALHDGMDRVSDDYPTGCSISNDMGAEDINNKWTAVWDEAWERYEDVWVNRITPTEKASDDNMWKKAYLDFIDNRLEGTIADFCMENGLEMFTVDKIQSEYHLIFIDEDNIPELLVSYNYYAHSHAYSLLQYKDGEVCVLEPLIYNGGSADFVDFEYAEGENKYLTSISTEEFTGANKHYRNIKTNESDYLSLSYNEDYIEYEINGIPTSREGYERKEQELRGEEDDWVAPFAAVPVESIDKRIIYDYSELKDL